jgi:uncharacterized protein (TIGR02996 family)
MDTRQALLQAVLASPDDDLPRLVLADHFEENGEVERAELIRIQCELSNNDRANRAGIPVGSDRWNAQVARMRDLFFGGAREWFHIPGLGHPAYSADRVLQWYGEGDSRGVLTPIATGLTDRGFIHEVRCPLGVWCGVKCRHCEGGYFGYPRSGVPDCPVCDASGWEVLAHGPAIVAAHPVWEVVLSGAVSGGRWHRISRESVGPLWPLLDTVRTDRDNFDFVEFASLGRADHLVSVAALLWAKSQPASQLPAPTS